jgi:hypothetical protein
VVVAATIAWGFVLAGSPALRRVERFDEQRLADLRTIAQEIQLMVVDPNDRGKKKLKEPLPKTLAEAAERARSQRLNPRDPETDEPYQFTVTGESTYELCAAFSGERRSDMSVFWNHPAGAHCFTIDVLDPPPY